MEPIIVSTINDNQQEMSTYLISNFGKSQDKKNKILRMQLKLPASELGKPWWHKCQRFNSDTAKPSKYKNINKYTNKNIKKCTGTKA